VALDDEARVPVLNNVAERRRPVVRGGFDRRAKPPPPGQLERSHVGEARFFLRADRCGLSLPPDRDLPLSGLTH
jgi:hypothetical protein